MGLPTQRFCDWWSLEAASLHQPSVVLPWLPCPPQGPLHSILPIASSLPSSLLSPLFPPSHPPLSLPSHPPQCPLHPILPIVPSIPSSPMSPPSHCSAVPTHPRCTTAVFGGLAAVHNAGPVGAQAFDEAEGQQGVVHRGSGVLVQCPDLLIEPTQGGTTGEEVTMQGEGL